MESPRSSSPGPVSRLLLHICCAPCAVYVMKILSRDYPVTGFFYNPNIHPEEEYRFRERELRTVGERLGWDLVFGAYHPEEWRESVRGMEREPERGRRCSRCFYLRLAETFRVAREEGFSVVASTLSISPYKVTRQINQEGERLAELFGVSFLGENFKKKGGYSEARKISTALGIRHQDYCGCVFSRRDRDERRRSPGGKK